MTKRMSSTSHAYDVEIESYSLITVGTEIALIIPSKAGTSEMS